MALTGVTGEPIRYFKVPHTTAAVRIPQAQGAIVGLDVGRSSERVLHAAPDGEAFSSSFTLDLSFLSGRKKKKGDDEPLQSGPQPWIGRSLDDIQLGDWRVAYRGRAQKEVVEQIIAGPLKDLLWMAPPLGYRISFKYGVLIVTQQHFLKTAEELDLVRGADVVARAADQRDLRRRGGPAAVRTAQLPPPSWAEKIDQRPDETFMGIDNQDLGGFHAIARQRGLASEDPYAFHRAFRTCRCRARPTA